MDLEYKRFDSPYDIRVALSQIASEGMYVAAARVYDGNLVLICRHLPESER